MKQLTSQIHAFGKALMMPISVIAAAGIFLGLAAAMQNPAITGDAFAQMQVPQLIIGFIRKVAGALFANLPVFFAVASAIGLAKAEKPTAAFAAVIGYIAMNVGINATLAAKGLTAATTTPEALQKAGMDQTAAMMTSAEYIQMLGIFTYNMSVLGGVIAGLLTVMLHNRFYTQQLPTAISFFGGRRFVPIVTVVFLPLVGVLLALIWPTLGAGIAWVGQMIGKSGQYGAFLLGTAERILIPTGLHHILNETVRFTPIGGIATVDGQTLVGALNIFNASLTHPGSVPDDTLRNATQFLAQGKIPVMMFGLPAAALAIYHTARPEHKQRVKALMMAGALTSFTTGITEPLEFCFIFVSPVLYLMHALLTGLSFMLMSMLHLMIGNVQGGVIDLVVFGILGGSKTHWWWTLALGALYAPLYYYGFRFIITRMGVETPGRESDDEKPQQVAAGERTRVIISGLGGEANIEDVDCCFTRLRVRVKDMKEVVDQTLLTTGANGINRVSEHDIQVIYGPQVEKIANEVKSALGVA
ncbi:MULTISPECIES: PTS transporter subunit EIIC [Pantoea]|mgnify:FL=1|jgi:PTS system maltose and glucose-specific IIC component|uniref:PTS transporter subunit EIIC n=1 Tax=Pantoea piersonii TaxID=2364647 RepID=A0AAJ5QM38_9GAMM|nr:MULTISPECIES: PTS transporter subunit EIIC [Pantoea]MDU6433509.1 PTS transporter subunit EIIC [Pantoea sp.]MBZ6386976.1 PTS transporter subunit EIIC [Pantoea piersonii]MBZ6400284.1 PTS transporter subunit EIIC [Pantoea piersonii]MBZ6408329.1 PTS transporter subunit EIIC [Pantoea piersonii]MBZ6426564.1 PTS transporter subunit EIIC [Pantoea piersonii]